MKKIHSIFISLFFVISLFLSIVSSCSALNGTTILPIEINDDTNMLEKPSVKIIKPEAEYSYFFNIKFKNLNNKIEITGPIIVKVNAESYNGIEKVEFYLDGVLKHVDRLEQYTWIWLFKPIGKNNFTISAIAYDTEGNTNTDSIVVTRNRFTPLRDHKFLALALVGGLGITYFLKNIDRGADEDAPVEPDENSEHADGQYDQSSSLKDKEGDDTFWYIVAAIAIAIATGLVILFIRRDVYE
jgi:hypothetical protein